MKTLYSVLVIAAIGTLSGGDITIRDPKNILTTAQRLETSRITEAGVLSPAGDSFVKLFTSPNAHVSFEELAKTAQTSAGKAYAIIGLYEMKRDDALALLKSLPSDFRVSVMWYGVKSEWSRDEFERQVRERRFFEALMHYSSP